MKTYLIYPARCKQVLEPHPQKPESQSKYSVRPAHACSVPNENILITVDYHREEDGKKEN